MPASQAALIDAFQAEQGISSRTEAIRLLLDIALESVTGRGRRFWDRPISDVKP